MAYIELNVNIDTDDIIDELETEELIQEVKRRGKCSKDATAGSKSDVIVEMLEDRSDIVAVATPSLIDREKIQFFLENRERISLQSLEKLIK